ncbi:hypothetical protein I6I97_17465 [Sphingobacterium multivorum]|uniref:hypothetical protein n=1 Tax=Sphingobacterium multivorum TaxID=28454 RepID=UPI00191814C5|nr:hypothetical protein [Sphingobacterium multivorum]QQT60990.1 hypothetical protein I6I97_17465 [Sphingobacterium multivorum]
MDYEKLDDILDFLKRYQGYAGWLQYKIDVGSRKEYIMDTINDPISYAGWCNSLLYWGLVDYKYDGNKQHTYIINPKGLELLQNGKSTKDIHDEFKNKENLEQKILKGTIESHEIGKTATKLNKFQLAVTIILGIVSAGTIYFQYEANKIAKKSVELSERAYDLELDNKGKIDTIFVKMNLKGSDTFKK